MTAIERIEKLNKAQTFFDELAELLKDEYEILESCNKDCSRYLIPKGTRSQVSYDGKPILSFRVSDHWNWFSRKSIDPNWVQCRSVDMPKVRQERNKLPDGTLGGSNPRFGIQVCIYGTDGVYHHIYGDKFNRKTREWEWVETTPEDVLNHTDLNFGKPDKWTQKHWDAFGTPFVMYNKFTARLFCTPYELATYGYAKLKSQEETLLKSLETLNETFEEYKERIEAEFKEEN